jgi:hypothetical protein
MEEKFYDIKELPASPPEEGYIYALYTEFNSQPYENWEKLDSVWFDYVGMRRYALKLLREDDRWSIRYEEIFIGGDNR